MAGDKKDKDARPIIIKKIKKGGHGHHGGAWKVAYADFVTAMMAFFLLLWLLSTSSKKTLEGLSEFFTPTVGIKDNAGIGFKGGESPTEGFKKTNTSTPGVVTGSNPQGQSPDIVENKASVESTEDNFLFDKAKEALKTAFDSDPNMREFTDNILVEQTPEGLKIEIMDSDKHPMFVSGKPELTEDGGKVLVTMRAVIEKAPNFISLTGHTDGAAPIVEKPGYSNWELSADRANAARRFFLKSGMDPERPKKVVGMADKELLDAENPRAAKNRRVTIILLRGSHMKLPGSDLPAARDMLNITPPGQMPEPIVQAPASDPAAQNPEPQKQAP
jgi:chemotaxis protein MotB